MDDEKRDQTIYERAEIGERVVFRVRELLRDLPIEVIGHQDSQAVCCRNGTVALVKLDLEQIQTPPQRRRTSR